MSRSRMDASANDADGLGLSGSAAAGNDLEAELEPLAEDTLTRNLGLDLIVVVTKVRSSGVLFWAKAPSQAPLKAL